MKTLFLKNVLSFNMNHDLPYLNAFNQIPFIGPMALKRLYQHFSTMSSAWKAKEREFEIAGLNPKQIQSILCARKTLDVLEKMQELERLNIKTMSFWDPAYPPLLKQIYAPPPLLYYKGQLPDCFSAPDQPDHQRRSLNGPKQTPQKQSPIPLLAIVGSRKHSHYGQRAVIELTQALTECGIGIVSGLALGIDTLAHQTCLENGGTTLAVVGSGLECVTPRENLKLADAIIQNGAVISEHPPYYPAQKQNFHARNRIISGLCLGVIIIESRERSGTLITANHALDQNREVFVVPGDIFSPYSKGNNLLIQNGAKLITCANDILEELNLERSRPNELADAPDFSPENPGLARSNPAGKKSATASPQNSPKHFSLSQKQKSALSLISPTDRLILENLSSRPIPFDKLVQLTKLGINVLLAHLTELELKDLIENCEGHYYLK